MSETVTRVRGGGLDSDDNPTATVLADLVARAIEPTPAGEVEGRGRSGNRPGCKVYFQPAVDLTDDDELMVRGVMFQVQVEDWRSAFGTGRSGTVAICTGGRG